MNKFIKFCLCCLYALALAGSSSSAQAQWLTQTLDLKAGWNAIHLHVDASHTTIDDLTASDPGGSIAEVWLWRPQITAQQFIQSPQEPGTGGHWLAWKRLDPASTTLQKLAPNSACLVRVRDDVPNYLWQVKGRAVLPRMNWSTTGMNFVGFPTVSDTPPSFLNFLGQAPADFRQAVEIFRYTTGELGPGNPVRVFALPTTMVRRGEAFWIRSGEVFNRYYGPFEASGLDSGSIEFGDKINTSRLRLRNLTTNQLVVTLKLNNSETPPPGQPAISGIPALIIRDKFNPTNQTYSYITLPAGTPRSWSLAPAGVPGSETEVVLGLDRSSMTGNAGNSLGGLLQLTDSLGQSRLDLGVTAQIGSKSGLWVGGAAVNQVGHYLVTYDRDASNNPILSPDGNYQKNGTNTTLGGVTSSFPLRLIVHNPASGPARLFQRIFFGRDASSNSILAKSEAPLNRKLLGEARRISAPHLPFSKANEGWSFSGPLTPGSTITTSVTNRFNDHSSNPFLHTYHPDHDNLNATFTQELPQGSESYTVVRDVTLSLLPPSDDFNARVTAGETQTGVYLETIRLQGLPRPGNTVDTRTMQIRGGFSLNRLTEISTITQLP